MSGKIKITIGERSLKASLYNNNTTKQLLIQLPMKIAMNRWGEEYYGDCGLMVNRAPDARQDMEPGELAVWPDGSALCIFFGPTPASIDEKPRAISPVNPVGKIEEDFSILKNLPSSIQVILEPLEE